MEIFWVGGGGIEGWVMEIQISRGRWWIYLVVDYVDQRSKFMIRLWQYSVVDGDNRGR